MIIIQSLLRPMGHLPRPRVSPRRTPIWIFIANSNIRSLQDLRVRIFQPDRILLTRAIADIDCVDKIRSIGAILVVLQVASRCHAIDCVSMGMYGRKLVGVFGGRDASSGAVEAGEERAEGRDAGEDYLHNMLSVSVQEKEVGCQLTPMFSSTAPQRTSMVELPVLAMVVI